MKKAILHPKLRDQHHQVFFDEGLFSSVGKAKSIAAEIGAFGDCTIHFEQDSQRVPGIQVADLIAHTCGTMLLDGLGKINKIVSVPNSRYDDDVEINLGFEMWAGIRYAFLSVCNGAYIDDEDFAVVRANRTDCTLIQAHLSRLQSPPENGLDQCISDAFIE